MVKAIPTVAGVLAAPPLGPQGQSRQSLCPDLSCLGFDPQSPRPPAVLWGLWHPLGTGRARAWPEATGWGRGLQPRHEQTSRPHRPCPTALCPSTLGGAGGGAPGRAKTRPAKTPGGRNQVRPERATVGRGQHGWTPETLRADPGAHRVVQGLPTRLGLERRTRQVCVRRLPRAGPAPLLVLALIC